MSKDLPVEPKGPGPERGRGRQSGACFTRIEAMMRSCSMTLALGWAAGYRLERR